jgi:hypothetical protein
MTLLAPRLLLDRFEKDGFVVAHDLLDVETVIEPVRKEYLAVLERLRADAPNPVAAGPEADLERQLIAVHEAYGRDLSRHFDISLPLADIKETTPIHLGPAIFRLLTAPRLLDAVSSVIGAEVSLHPLQKIRIKLPDGTLPIDAGALLDTTPWHQDVGILDEAVDGVDLLTAWIPLTEATETNGALALLPGTHRSDILVHCPIPASFGTEIPSNQRPDVEPVVVEMRPGSVLFIHRRTVHYSLPNRTDDSVRMSLDLRYIPTGSPTGRPAGFPSIPVRSKDPEADVIDDPVAWALIWQDARAGLAGKAIPSTSRWGADHPSCE